MTLHPSVAWVLGVSMAALVVHGLSRWVLGILDRRLDPDNQNATLAVLNRVVVTFVYLLAALLLSYAVVDASIYDRVTENLFRIVWFFVVVVCTILGVAAVQIGFDRAIARAVAARDGSQTTYRFFKNVAVGGTYLTGALLFALAIPGLQTVAQSALAGAGVLAVVAGVASQEALSNLVGGLLIVVFRPFRIGDTLKIGGELTGVVEDITLRHTILRNFRNQRIVVPNAVINKEVVINFDMQDARVCCHLEIGVSYGADLGLAKQLIEQACLAHPLCMDVRTPPERAGGSPQVPVRVVSLGDSSIVLRAWVWAPNQADSFVMTCDLYERIKLSLDQHGIEIPFPQRTVHLVPPSEVA